jgi:hypothetical protein
MKTNPADLNSNFSIKLILFYLLEFPLTNELKSSLFKISNKTQIKYYDKNNKFRKKFLMRNLK